MYRVYEEFKSDGKRFFRFESADRFECEVWVDHHQYERAVCNGWSQFVVEAD